MFEASLKREYLVCYAITMLPEAQQTTPEAYSKLASRLGDERLAQRRQRQRELDQKHSGLSGLGQWLNPYRIFGWGLKLTGLWSRGVANFIDVQVVHNTISIVGLPDAFDGYRILHIADLHLDLHEPLIEKAKQVVSGLAYDLCLNTGDFRNRTLDSYAVAMAATARFCEGIRQPHYGVLGNHDYIEKVPELEAMGMRMLLNEAVELQHQGASIWLVGVDDPYFYETHDLQEPLTSVPAGGIKLLAAHSPNCYRVAEALGYQVQFSGHTHGGQICLPGGIPIVKHCAIPRQLIAGPWRHGNLQGYTSRGVGGCQLPIRFHCPPEVLLHTLRVASPDETK